MNRAIALLLMGIVMTASVSHAGVRSIWAVNDGERVDRNDLDNPNKAKNSAWDGKTIHLFGARNEVLAFQVIVESDDQGIEGLSASLPELVGPEGRKIVYAPPKEDPTDYVGRQIQVFSMHYIQVQEATSAGWIFNRRSPAAPPNPIGWKPEVLVPENAKAGMGGFPLSVPANANQSIWFEVYTPRDLPAGIYRGTVTINVGDQATQLPVELQVYDFTLPDQNTMMSMLFFQSGQVVKYQGANLDDRYHRFAHRHRVELVNAYSPEAVRRNIGRFNGQDFTKEKGYEGPGEGVGNVIIPLTFYGPGNRFNEEESARRVSDEWMTFLNQTVPGAVTFLYMPDEPSRQQYPNILQIGNNIRNNPGPGGKLPILVTHRYSEELSPVIDIWCMPTEAYRIDEARKLREAGQQVWVYNGHRPHVGSFDYSTPATDPRATVWGCFKHDINLHFYWHSNHWEHNSQKPDDRDQNIWKDSITFDNRRQTGRSGGAFANGDGVLMYPGQERVHPDQDRGIAGPCGSLRLANLRRGLQDHLYLTMARQLGLNDVVDEALNAVAGKMFSDAGREVGFAQTGNEFEAVRKQLAEAIARKINEH